MFMYLNRDKVTIHITHHLFMEIGIIQLECVKKKSRGKELLLGKNSPIQFRF